MCSTLLLTSSVVPTSLLWYTPPFMQAHAFSAIFSASSIESPLATIPNALNNGDMDGLKRKEGSRGQSKLTDEQF